MHTFSITYRHTHTYIYINPFAFHLSASLPLEVQRTEFQCLLGGIEMCKQCVLPPHDIVSSLYNFPENFFPLLTGEPGRLSKYWDENMDLYESLSMPDLDP